MLSLLHPAALWTLAALALPLAIHLRRPPPRTVRLGSLRFLENIPRRPWRNPRWRELLLLCMRLGLLAALSLLLAEPRWIDTPPNGPRRWALLDPTAVLTGDALTRWHTVGADGYELRRLTPGFPRAPDKPSTGYDDVPAPDLWSLLREADAELPAGSTLAVFSPGRLSALRGNRPALAHCRVEWFQTPDLSGEQPHLWVAEALPQRILEGRSDARSTVFAPKPSDGSGVPVPAAVSVLILHDAEHIVDARYVEVAVRAAADSAGRPVNVQNREITPDAENAAATQWIFWLSTRPVPDGLANRAPRIVRYAGGDAVTMNDWIAAPPGDSVGGIRLWKRAVSADRRAGVTAWWNDGQGNPVLTRSRSVRDEWEFYTRFDPEWTDLPRTTALPAWVRARLFPETAALAEAGPLHDRRLADPSQGRPSETLAATTIPALAPADQPFRELRWPLWILAALLFMAERVLSLRRTAAPELITRPRPEPAAAAAR